MSENRRLSAKAVIATKSAPWLQSGIAANCAAPDQTRSDIAMALNGPMLADPALAPKTAPNRRTPGANASASTRPDHMAALLDGCLVRLITFRQPHQ